MPNLKIYSDNAIEAAWFKNLHPHFGDVEEALILSRGQNNPVINGLIHYDRPDIILVSDEQPLLMVEKLREVPTGHNVGQRIARHVRAAEHGVPSIQFLPFDAKKHGQYSGICNLNIRLLIAFDKMFEIHQTPVIALNWISDDYGELVDDGSEDDEIKKVIGAFVNSSFDRNDQIFDTIRGNNKKEYTIRLAAYKGYANPPPSVSFISTETYIDQIPSNLNQREKDCLLRHPESVVYKIGMTEGKCKRQDPFTGTQFIYDYAYCRNGPKPKDKYKNLILCFPKIRKNVWLEKNPNDTHTKSCNWYLTASALIFSDGALIL